MLWTIIFQFMFLVPATVVAMKIFTFKSPKPIALLPSNNDNNDKRLISSYVIADDKLKIELLFAGPNNNQSKRLPTLLFLHGSGGGAWIYNDWLEYFANLGFNTYAIGLRGSFGTGMTDLQNVINLSDIISDLRCVLKFINRKHGATICQGPVILGHSFGGLVLSALLEDKSVRSCISGAVWMATLPPSGQQSMATRFLYTRFFHTINIIRGFAFGAAQKSPVMNKLLFYDDDTPETDVLRYMTRLQKDAKFPLNFTQIENMLPSKKSTNNGEAMWLKEIIGIDEVKDGKKLFKRFVFGSNNDYIVDQEAIREMAKFVGTKPVYVNGPGHNIMLGAKWRVAADTIRDWLLKEFC